MPRRPHGMKLSRKPRPCEPTATATAMVAKRGAINWASLVVSGGSMTDLSQASSARINRKHLRMVLRMHRRHFRQQGEVLQRHQRRTLVERIGRLERISHGKSLAETADAADGGGRLGPAILHDFRVYR